MNTGEKGLVSVRWGCSLTGCTSCMSALVAANEHSLRGDTSGFHLVSRCDLCVSRPLLPTGGEPSKDTGVRLACALVALFDRALLFISVTAISLAISALIGCGVSLWL